MSFEGVIINKGEFGLNRTNASTDAVMALIAHSPEVANPAYNTAIRCIQASDLDDAAFDAAYDANNAVLVRHHVEEFFRLAPLGTLYVIPTDKTTAALFFASPEASAIFRQNTDIKRAGFVYNAEVLDLDLTAEANAAQLFINDLKDDHIFLDGIYLEARTIGTDAVTMRTLTAQNVSLVIAQDDEIAAMDAAYAGYSAVGSALGMRAARKVNENLGSVDIINKPNDKKGDISYPLTDPLRGRWITTNLSDGTPVSSLTQVERKQLTDFGYIYAGNFQGFGGYYFNGEPTCVELASDYSTGENNGVWNKAARGIRTALLPRVRGWFKRNADTGELGATATANLENLGKKPLDTMVANEEISGYSIRIPAGQNPNDQTPLQVFVTVRLGAIIHEFIVDLSLN